MDEFNNNGGQGYNPMFNEQPTQNFNEQPNGTTQFGESTNVYGGQPQYNDQPQYDSNMNGMPQEQKGLSIASMVCGILSLIGCWCCGLGLILAIAAIVLGILGRKKGGKGFGLAGIICGSIGVIGNLIYLVYFIIVIMDQL